MTPGEIEADLTSGVQALSGSVRFLRTP